MAVDPVELGLIVVVNLASLVILYRLIIVPMIWRYGEPRVKGLLQTGAATLAQSVNWKEAWSTFDPAEQLDKLAKTEAGRDIINNFLTALLEEIGPTIRTQITYLFKGQGGGDRKQENAALGQMIWGLLDKAGISALLEPFGAKEIVVKNPIGALKAAVALLGRERVEAMLDRFLPLARLESGAFIHSEENVNNPPGP